MASDEPRASCQPTRKTSATTASAIASVSHSNALSPKRDGGFILAATEPAISGAAPELAKIAIVELSPGPPLYLDLVDPFQHTLLQTVRQRRILEILRHFLSIFRGPF